MAVKLFILMAKVLKVTEHTSLFYLFSRTHNSLVKAKWFSLSLNNELNCYFKNSFDPRTELLICLNKNI